MATGTAGSDTCLPQSLMPADEEPLGNSPDSRLSNPEAEAHAAGDGVRLRAGGVVLRKSAETSQLEVLLISRRRVPDSFTIPAGKFENDTDGGSFENCALRETKEEAGIECDIIFDLGWYRGTSKDTSETRTRFFAMRYLREMPAWKEEGERSRHWRSLDKVEALVCYNPVLVRVFRQVQHTLKERCVNGDDVLQSVSEINLARTSDTLAMDQASISSGESLGLPEAEELEEVVLAVQDTDTGENEQLDTGDKPHPSAVSNGEECKRKPSNHQVNSIDPSKLQIEDVDGERFCFYRNQVGGHFCLVKPAPTSHRISVKTSDADGGSSIVELVASDVVLKPLDEKEYKIYKEILRKVPELVPHLAYCFGTKTLTHRQVSAMTAEVKSMIEDTHETKQNDSEEQTSWVARMRSHHYQAYIVLQDLACAMEKPRILDLKMGFKQRSKRHTLRKREKCRQKARSTTSHLLGFRICGMHTEEVTHDKYWGRQLSAERVFDVLHEFLLHSRASEEEQRSLLTDLLVRVGGLRKIITDMHHWRFWNTSLLILYDGAQPGARPDVRMIDFAHCTRVRGDTSDEELLCSLRNVEVFLEAVRDGKPYESWVAKKLADNPAEDVQDAEELEGEEDPGSASSARETVSVDKASRNGGSQEQVPSVEAGP